MSLAKYTNGSPGDLRSCWKLYQSFKINVWAFYVFKVTDKSNV